MGGRVGDRYRQDCVGQATVGVVLVIAMVIVGSTAVFALGDRALSDTERQSDVERAQQAMTLFDSQAAQVALSESDRQTVRFGRTSGSYRVDPTAGEISIINVDRDDNGVNDDDDIDPDTTSNGNPNDDEYLLEPTTMGAVVYENGDRTIAYQGGGVWQRTADGGARMVSPPEFHYRSQTLTLPVVQVVGEGSAAGSARATVSTGGFRARPVYPNASRTFDIGDPDPFENPVQNGSVIVRIESEYAEAWGAYFDARTEGNVSYPADGVVTVELVSLAQVGRFDMPLEGGAVTISGTAGGHGIRPPGGAAGETAFSIRLRPDDADGAKFSNLQWSLYAEEGDHEFEMHLKKTGGGDDCKDGSTNLGAHLTIYYSWNDGEDYHGWRTTSPIQAQCKDLDPSDAEEEIYLDVTFVDDGLDPDGADNDGEYDDNEDGNDVQLEFQALSSNDLEHFNPNGDLDGSRALDGHSAPWEPVTPTTGSPGTTMATDQLVNHYFGELPDEFDLRVDDKNSDTTNEDASSGEFYNAGSARYVTYLHVTTNQVEVEVED